MVIPAHHWSTYRGIADGAAKPIGRLDDAQELLGRLDVDGRGRAQCGVGFCCLRTVPIARELCC